VDERAEKPSTLSASVIAARTAGPPVVSIAVTAATMIVPA
jgi:hypothetical protein